MNTGRRFVEMCFPFGLSQRGGNKEHGARLARSSVPGPALIAHRGGTLEAPDSTLAAFDHAISVGSDWLELDVRLTRDGHLVVIHDATVDRTTEGSGRVDATTLSELRRLDAAYWWRPLPKSQEFPWRGSELKVPTLDEVFTRYPGTPMLVDMKSRGIATVLAVRELLDRHERFGSTVVASFHDESLGELRKLDSRAVTAVGTGGVRSFTLLDKVRLGRFWRGEGAILAVPLRQGRISLVTHRSVRAARRQGLEVFVWTINDEPTMRRLIELGVDGIITDRPRLLSKILGRSSPSPSRAEPRDHSARGIDDEPLVGSVEDQKR